MLANVETKISQQPTDNLGYLTSNSFRRLMMNTLFRNVATELLQKQPWTHRTTGLHKILKYGRDPETTGTPDVRPPLTTVRGKSYTIRVTPGTLRLGSSKKSQSKGQETLDSAHETC